MLNSYKTMILTMFVLVLTANAQEQQAAVRIDTKIKNDSEHKKQTVFSIDDTTTKFKIDPAELNQIKNMDVQTMKEKIEMMKDKVLDSKSRLVESSKDELSADVPLSYLAITHKNDMSGRFTILSLKYILDGKNIFSYYNSDNANKKSYSIFGSFVAPGHHEVVVEAVVCGNADGIFDYLKDYRIKTQDRFAFIVPNKKKTIISSVSYEKGGMFTSFKDRPGVKFSAANEDKIAEKIEQ